MTVRLAYNRQIPMLGICRGIQTIAVALGGKVCQDINSASPTLSDGATVTSRIKHSQDADRQEPTHSVNIKPCTTLSKLYGERAFVNSFHHQAVAKTGPRFNVSATSPDGIIEAMESNEYKSIIGVQWHPEWLGDDGLPLFSWLVERANEFREAKELHERILTLDTHCDTPMFFPQGVRFDQRDPRILYDLHKMTEGRHDAVIMAAYLPQPQLGEQFSQR